MFVVGLTGGIGSGKSTVAQLFLEHGVPIIDADIIAREITQPGQPAFLDIIDHFQETVLLENGSLDRSKIRKIIFSNTDERCWLEQLLHPLIRKEIERQIKKISVPYCIAVIPLLLEAESYPFINRILVIDAPTDIQIERVAFRDKIEKKHVKDILKAQMQREHRLTKAHDVIHNIGNLSELIPQVDSLHKKYLEMASK